MSMALSRPPPGRFRPGAKSLRATAAACSCALPKPSRRKSEELARTIALETGNALRTQARPEARLTADIFRYFGGLASELKGETIPLGDHLLSCTRREPIGVVGAIIPWNAPVLLGALKIAPALCAGNTIVLKAAEGCATRCPYGRGNLSGVPAARRAQRPDWFR
jgi:acyl-CoA reductase-like NAD-dependent aldehyde dehydrogenase